MELLPGLLVKIHLPAQESQPITSGAAGPPVQLNGAHAQLVSYDQQYQLWTVMTFSGIIAHAKAEALHPLSHTDMTYDYVLGPQTNLHAIAEDLSAHLSREGHAVIRPFLSEEDAERICTLALELEEDEQFDRLADLFERGYLGRGRAAKTLFVDPDDEGAPDIVRNSPLPEAQSYFVTICSIVKEHSESLLGFKTDSTSRMMMQLPLCSGEESSYEPLDVNDEDAEEYLHLMHRRRATLLFFMSHGPAGRVTLHAKHPDEPDIELEVEPYTILCVLDQRFEYSFEADNENSLILQSLLLDEPPNFVIESVSGDKSLLGILGSGPKPPQKNLDKQVSLMSMDCRYGGSSNGAKQYWAAACKGGTDAVTWVSCTRWDWQDVYDPESKDGVYTQHGCFGIEGVQFFDGKYFELHAKEACCMDPLQRQVMEVSYLALDQAGWTKPALRKQSPGIGCFVGMDKDDWMEMEECRQSPKEYLGTGASWCITANRVSFSLNLKGASMTVDTACSSSLVATHVAKLHLRNQEDEPMPAALVNGVNLMLSAKFFKVCCGANMLSRKGRCYTYNASADGYTRGELCGSGVFKVQQASEPSSLACLAGTMVNQDGRSASLTAPNGPAQERALQAVVRELNVSPHEIDCIECHGTGTALGDPIELSSFLRVLCNGTREEPLLICTSKSIIAHGEGGAGFGGFFKCCEMVMHCEAAGNLHLRLLNEHIEVGDRACSLLTEGLSMRASSAYAGVNSFGFGGTNAHGQAWGKNRLTSRGVPTDERELFCRKLRKTNPAEVIIKGLSYLNWEYNGGPELRAEQGDQFIVEIDQDGEAYWEKVSRPEHDSHGDVFFIQGTHNNWIPEPLDAHSSIEGLWVGAITIGKSEEEQFQILADESQSMIYHPGKDRCTSRAAKIQGPGVSSREHAWLVKGRVGQVLEVEFWINGDSKSITWLK